MLDFETFVSRHGEIGAQALLEMMERIEQIKIDRMMPLSDRWQIVMCGHSLMSQAA